MKFGIVILIALGFSIQSWSQATLKVGTGGKIQVSNNTALVVHGDIKNNGEITIENGSSLIQTEVGGISNSGTGNYVINRVGLNTSNGYNMWSSPISSSILHGTNGVFDGSNACDMYVFNASTQEWKNDFLDGYSTTCNGNPVTFTSASLMTDGNADGIMDVSRGYFLPGSSNSERVFSGDVNNGTFQTAIYATTLGDRPDWSGDDWNMVGNPYPSALDLQKFWEENSPATITDGIYFWVDDGSGGADYHEYNDYAVWNTIGSVSAGSQQANPSSSAVNGFAASGQGFWVHSAHSGNTSAHINFDNSMRTSNQNQKFYKRSNDSIQKAWLTVYRGAYKSNQILIGLTDNATVGYDAKFDARRMQTEAPMELSFVQDTALYIILGQPSISYNEQEVLPLHFKCDTAGMHSFALDSTQNVNGGNKYYLIDSILNVTHDLSIPYTTQLDTGSYDNRFYLLYKDVVNGIEDTQAQTYFVKAYQTGEDIKLQSNKLNITDVVIYNTVGAMIFSQNGMRNSSVTVNVSNFTQGVYLVNYTLENGLTETQKLVLY